MARRRGVHAFGLALVLVGGALVCPSMPAGAEGEGPFAFQASAEAAAVRMTMTVANGPATNNPVDVPGPIARAAVNSLGSSSAFASFPYPGDVAVSVPGLIPAVVPGAPSVPGYPFYVKSEHPLVPKSQQAAGAVELSAESTETSSKAAGSAGPKGDGPGAMRSEASVTETADTAVASAKAVVAGFTAGPLTIGRVVSIASVTLLADGTLQRKSGLELSGLRIGDQAVGITSNGFVLPGSGVPFPAGMQDQFRSALAASGTTVEFLPERRTDDGVVAAGLRIRQERDMPNGRDALTWVIGQATASAVGGAADNGTHEVALDAAPGGNRPGGSRPEIVADPKEVLRSWAS